MLVCCIAVLLSVQSDVVEVIVCLFVCKALVAVCTAGSGRVCALLGVCFGRLIVVLVWLFDM